MDLPGQGVDDRHKRGKQGETDRWDVDHAGWYKYRYRTGVDPGGMSDSRATVAGASQALRVRTYIPRACMLIYAHLCSCEQ